MLCVFSELQVSSQQQVDGIRCRSALKESSQLFLCALRYGSTDSSSDNPRMNLMAKCDRLAWFESLLPAAGRDDGDNPIEREKTFEEKISRLRTHYCSFSGFLRQPRSTDPCCHTSFLCCPLGQELPLLLCCQKMIVRTILLPQFLHSKAYPEIPASCC